MALAAAAVVVVVVAPATAQAQGGLLLRGEKGWGRERLRRVGRSRSGADRLPGPCLRTGRATLLDSCPKMTSETRGVWSILWIATG